MFWEETNVLKRKSPIENFLEWKSKEGQFEMYTKDMGNILLNPKDFILIDSRFCVNWWDDKSNSGIYSNSITNISKDELSVGAFKWGNLYTGLYDKDKIANLGGKLYKELIVCEGGLLNEYKVRGSAMFSTNECLASIDTNNYKIEFDGTEEKKKGSVTYVVPKWKQWAKITDQERNEAIEKVMILKEYFNN